MLLELRIKNFAIIDNLQLMLGPGLNVFTGETGAGKSIIIDAVKLVLGDRAASDLIRSSEEEAVVEALFDISAYKGVMNVLEEAGIPGDENLMIRRIISRSGRNKIFINDTMATLVTIAELGGRLIDICGQSEHQSLTRPEEHIETLDAFCGLWNIRKEMAHCYSKLAVLQGEFDNLFISAQNKKERQELLTHQLKEIEAANLREGEDDEIKREKERLSNAEKLFAAVSDVDKILYSGEDSTVERLGRVINRVKEVAMHDERLLPYIEALNTSGFQIEEAAAFFRDYAGKISFDEGRLDEVGKRLDLIMRLKNKYGRTIGEILKKKEEIEKELNNMERVDERIDELGKVLEDSRKKAFELAASLSKKRVEGALKLKKEVEGELASLAMEGTVFDVRVKNEVTPAGSPKLGEKGMNKVVFFLSPNPGEEPRPLAKIASGGELSRIMLAMKKVAATGRVPTIIFDEVDSGVGGGIADVIGREMNEVSKKHQVLCITHMPQIATYANLHYTVFKETGGGRTFTRVNELKGDAVVEEFARMLGGTKVTDKTREHARDIYDGARIK